MPNQEETKEVRKRRRDFIDTFHITGYCGGDAQGCFTAMENCGCTEECLKKYHPDIYNEQKNDKET